MNNPFEEIEARLSSIEILLLDLKNNGRWCETYDLNRNRLIETVN